VNEPEEWRVHLNRLVVDGPLGCSPQALATAVADHLTRLLAGEAPPTGEPGPAGVTAETTAVAVAAGLEHRGVSTRSDPKAGG
jgi:hypothetical protein